MNLGTRANVKVDMVRLPLLASKLFNMTPEGLPLIEPAVQAG
jgi:hypothetical protein